jgi:hypothetical protein
MARLFVQRTIPMWPLNHFLDSKQPTLNIKKNGPEPEFRP